MFGKLLTEIMYRLNMILYTIYPSEPDLFHWLVKIERFLESVGYSFCKKLIQNGLKTDLAIV